MEFQIGKMLPADPRNADVLHDQRIGPHLVKPRQLLDRVLDVVLVDDGIEGDVDLFLTRQECRVPSVRCGANWRFGKGGKGNAEFLRLRGFDVEVVPYAEFKGERISSSRIRAALAAGNLVAANAMLGRPYSLSGRIVSGKGLGRSMGFPTLNVLPKLADSPLARGVYAVATPFGRGLANWGVAPTMGERAWKSPVLEVHLLGETSICSQDVSDAELRVAFLSFLRPMLTSSGYSLALSFVSELPIAAPATVPMMLPIMALPGPECLSVDIHPNASPTTPPISAPAMVPR